MVIYDVETEYYNYGFTDGSKVVHTTNDVEAQASRIEKTLSTDPNRVYDFLAQPIWEVHDHTLEAINLALDHFVNQDGTQEAFSTFFWKNWTYEKWSLGNSVAQDYFE